MTDTQIQQLAQAAFDKARTMKSVPASTYRLQMHGGFTFADATRIVPYLHNLGITHLYLSPILKARPGSNHGYDVLDPTCLNPEVGTEEEFRALVAEAHKYDMGVVLDIVPNHMAISPANPWWHNVFEHGPSSPYAAYFDIAWDDPPRPEARGKVMLPVLGVPYYQALESDVLKLEHAEGAFTLKVHDGQAFPIDPRSYNIILQLAQEELSAIENVDAEMLGEFQSIQTSIENLPPREETDPARVENALAETLVIKRRLHSLEQAHAEVRTAIDNALSFFKKAETEAHDRFDALLNAQAYRLCYWRVASDEINYRRFFDINELSALSMERADLFHDAHELVLGYCAEGLLQGLRIDHPDGLYDPREYLQWVQLGYVKAIAKRMAEEKGDNWSDIASSVTDALRPKISELDSTLLYTVVEKIISHGESLPSDWLTDGTTGYDVLNAIGGLFVDPASEEALTETFVRFTKIDDPLSEIVYQSKMLIISAAFASELGMLAHRLDRLGRKNRRARDFTLNGLRRALRAVIASFPVYRAYVVDTATQTDELMTRLAVRRGRLRSPTISPDLFDFIRDSLLLRIPEDGLLIDESIYKEEQRRFAGRFQQLTAPVTAKGVEDTSFYVFNRFVSLNEVGGEPDHFGMSVEGLHNYLTDRQATFPRTMNAGSTHDTKRGEDTRARLNVLSEMPQEWTQAVNHWAKLNAGHRTKLEDGPFAPDRNTEYLLYQILVGIWDESTNGEHNQVLIDRVQPYMEKAIHEAKQHSSWINPDVDYDNGVHAFVAAILDPSKSAEFLQSFAEFNKEVARRGIVNGLSQALLRCTVPGIPDTYRGTEVWDLTLVDPDNRRPVDFDTLNQQLDALNEVPSEIADGRSKQFLLNRVLRFRRENPELFLQGSYEPIEVTGSKAEHVFAFRRKLDHAEVVIAVPRLSGADGFDWGDTTLSLNGKWTNLLTDEAVSSFKVVELFKQFPVVMLTHS